MYIDQIKKINNRIVFMEYHNSMAPFPIYDTEIIEDLRTLIIILENMADKKEYDQIPVNYCTTCLSLKILTLENTTVDYCGKCGNSSIVKNTIEIWEKEYEELYGNKFIEGNRKLGSKR